MSELVVLARMIAERVAARPYAAVTLGYLAANFVGGFILQYQREHARVDAALDARAAFVRSIADRLREREHNAPHTITDAEIAERMAPGA